MNFVRRYFPSILLNMCCLLSCFFHVNFFHGINNLEPQRLSTHELEDKILGSLLAAAIGDALGRVTEFLSIDQIKARYGKLISGFEDFKEQDFRMIDGKKTALFTDDTAMAVLVFISLLDSTRHGYSLDKSMTNIAAMFLWDYQMNKNGWAAPFRAPGNNCLRAIKAIEHRFGMQVDNPRWWDLGATAAGGCGSVMHAYPFGLIFYNDAQKAASWAAEHSKITHGAPMAIAACAAFATGVAYAVQGRSCQDIVAGMAHAARFYGNDETTAKMIEEAAALAKDNSMPSEKVFEKYQGWAAHEAIAAATYIFVRYPDNAQEALAMGVNTPGDSDSIASIAGSLVGAYCGAHAIKQATLWQDIVENGHTFTHLAHEAAECVSAS